MRKGSSVCHIPVSNSQPTQRAVCVCVQRSSALLLPWSKGEGEEGEQVAYLVLDYQGPTITSDELDTVLIILFG